MTTMRTIESVPFAGDLVAALHAPDTGALPRTSSAWPTCSRRTRDWHVR